MKVITNDNRTKDVREELKMKYLSREIGSIYRSSPYSFELLPRLRFEVLGKPYLLSVHSEIDLKSYL